MIHSYRAEFSNVRTGDKKTVLFDSTKNFIEAWEEAISYFNTELLELDKAWSWYEWKMIK